MPGKGVHGRGQEAPESQAFRMRPIDLRIIPLVPELAALFVSKSVTV